MMRNNECTSEYLEGRAAFLRGLPDDVCPYPSGSSIEQNSRRYLWMLGYFATKYPV